ncbi:hypothetical protein H7849_08715 [Alloacidobacterium dinghuense]|uniref:Uncharacterized protein n=1 Tax=Alloacidobacterium dinghuense TaxID=2763107 RepID=A0A7G8BN50_9BACT|nr:hypothetical protein [Alloacidobacterium dinghuense]QNI33970.1 hypothetical protein H7849_08715 [Alloacidobacterium dinghuense]
MRGHSRFDREKCDRSDSDAGTKGSPNGKAQRHQQQSVQGEHRDPCTLLHCVRVVVEVDVFFGKRALVLLIRKEPQGARSKTGGGDAASHPQLDQRRMLRVDPKITEPPIVNTGGDVISLVDGEPIKPGRDSGAHDCSRYEQKKQTVDEAYANSWCVPVSYACYCKICCLAKNLSEVFPPRSKLA